jgi:isocitrate dehydrogenase
MSATLRILDAAGAQLDVRSIDLGEKVYLSGHLSGIAPESWESIQQTGILLKGPVTTPQGKGYKSVNVTLRKTLGLFANVRPCPTYHPFVSTDHPGMDVVIVRENEEDLYAGIEHRQTDEVYQCLKLITRPGCEKIARYAFAYAKANGRKKVTCMTKDNIMKLTDGLFHQVFDEVGREYPDIQQEHLIIDIGMARLAKYPERFDVILAPNLYGDILSDVAAEVAGSVGLAGSSNIGVKTTMFEAIHGSAPDIAGKDIANPSGLLLSAVQMLVHVGQTGVAEKVHNAWLSTLEAGIHTVDVVGETTTQTVGTQAFADAVISRLGHEPSTLSPIRYFATESLVPVVERQKAAAKELVGMDVFISWRGEADPLAEVLKQAEAGPLFLQMVTNRGVKVWPGGNPETGLTDHWRCRFMTVDTNRKVSHRMLVDLLARVSDLGLDFIKSENLCCFDGVPGYSLGQGQ